MSKQQKKALQLPQVWRRNHIRRCLPRDLQSRDVVAGDDDDSDYVDEDEIDAMLDENLKQNKCEYTVFEKTVLIGTPNPLTSLV